MKKLSRDVDLTMDQYNQYFEDIQEWDAGSIDYAENALEDIGREMHGITVTDDSTGKLIGICSFSILPDLDYELSSSFPRYMKDRLEEILTLSGYEEYTEAIFIDWLAGNRHGGGSQIINELKSLAREADVPIVVNSDPSGTSFYEKHNFKDLGENGAYLIWTYSLG